MIPAFNNPRLAAQQQKDTNWRALHQRLEAIAPENQYARDMLELAKDTDHAGRVNFRSLEEAYQARYLAKAGIWPEPSRGPKGSDFVSREQQWDLKTETSYPITSNAGYSDERMQRKIDSKLSRGIQVAIDQTALNREDRERLRSLLATNSHWTGKVFTFERRASSAAALTWGTSERELLMHRLDGCPQLVGRNQATDGDVGVGAVKDFHTRLG